MKSIKIIWNDGAHRGTVAASHASWSAPVGEFACEQLEICFESAVTDIGSHATIVNIQTEKNPFSFFLRDVTAENPIWLPDCEVVVTTAADRRSYSQIVAEIKSKGGKTKYQQMQEEAEYSFTAAAGETRDLPGPAWLGVSKDMRLFEVGIRSKSNSNDREMFEYVLPRLFSKTARPAELGDREPRYSMMAGRGIGCKHELQKRLEDGYLPILNARNFDDGVVYDMQFFATLEQSPLDKEHLRGTDMYVADAHGVGQMFTKKQQEHADKLMDAELSRPEETVMYVKIEAKNTLQAPAYSYVKLPDPVPGREYDKTAPKIEYDNKTGFISYAASGRVCCIATVDGQPVPQEEMSVLLAPGQTLTYIYKIPHQPLDPVRAARLAEHSYQDRLAEAKRFWQAELAGTARITLPEKRIEEMIKAGLLHIDIGYFGKNPAEPVVPIVGVYTAIGSESSPAIQFLDTVGEHQLASRALQYFVEKQHEDGFMQNFGGYMLETGSVLWTMGEHYRLTRDTAWVESVQESIIKASEHLISWREKNLGDELKGGRGYGMISGKIADPEDHFHSFMLNAGAYVGLARAAEMLVDCAPDLAERYGEISGQWRENIRESFERSLAVSPALPLGDGSWIRSFAPWTEYVGPVSMYALGGKWYTHGIFNARDMTSAAYLVLQEVIDPAEPLAKNILSFYNEYITLNNTAFSQSYYSPHPYIHARRGEVKPFLKEFYSGFASLADRETYSFWEHYFLASPHKLHEEGWFLMRCRWLLCLEEYEKRRLNLLSMVPRKWLDDSQVIAVQGMKTYYGELSYKVESRIDAGRIYVEVDLAQGPGPAVETLAIRLPHPASKKAIYTTAGNYCAYNETVTLTQFAGKASFELVF